MFHCIIKMLQRNIDNGKLTDVLFVDLSKAFDTANQYVLLHKLLSFSKCSITPTCFNFLVFIWQIDHGVLDGVEFSHKS